MLTEAASYVLLRYTEAMDNELIHNWMTLYEAAWRASGTPDVGSVFAPNATYQISPFKPLLHGLPAIERFWQQSRSPDETFTMHYELVASEGDVAVVRVDVHYATPKNQVWKDLWIIQLDSDGLCFAFEEWPFTAAQPDGHEDEA